MQDSLLSGGHPGIPGYEIRDALGSGGSAVVYRARQVALDREVALKIIAGEEAKEIVLRFLREIEIQKGVRHPNLVQVYDAGTVEGYHYLAMELVEGDTLARWIGQEERSLKKVIRIGRSLADGLTELHRMGIVHRDLKPSNVLITRDSVIKIIDYGLARADDQTRLTRDDALVGTVPYLSPEFICNATCGPPADVYALGLIFYQALCGKLPYRGYTLPEWMGLIVKSIPARVRTLRPDVPVGLDRLIDAMLAKDPASRPGADEVRVALEKVRTPKSGARPAVPGGRGEVRVALEKVRTPESGARPAATGGRGVSPRPGRRFLIPGLILGVGILGILAWRGRRLHPTRVVPQSTLLPRVREPRLELGPDGIMLTMRGPPIQGATLLAGDRRWALERPETLPGDRIGYKVSIAIWESHESATLVGAPEGAWPLGWLDGVAAQLERSLRTFVPDDLIQSLVHSPEYETNYTYRYQGPLDPRKDAFGRRVLQSLRRRPFRRELEAFLPRGRELFSDPRAPDVFKRDLYHGLLKLQYLDQAAIAQREAPPLGIQEIYEPLIEVRYVTELSPPEAKRWDIAGGFTAWTPEGFTDPPEKSGTGFPFDHFRTPDENERLRRLPTMEVVPHRRVFGPLELPDDLEGQVVLVAGVIFLGPPFFHRVEFRPVAGGDPLTVLLTHPGTLDWYRLMDGHLPSEGDDPRTFEARAYRISPSTNGLILHSATTLGAIFEFLGALVAGGAKRGRAGEAAGPLGRVGCSACGESSGSDRCRSLGVRATCRASPPVGEGLFLCARPRPAPPGSGVD